MKKVINHMPPRVPNLLGKKIGRLKVSGLMGIVNDETHWIANCSCGGLTRLTTEEIINKTIRDCGCRKGPKRYQDPDELWEKQQAAMMKRAPKVLRDLQERLDKMRSITCPRNRRGGKAPNR